MTYVFKFSDEAKEDVLNLPNVIKERIGKKIKYFAGLPDVFTVAKRLTNSDLGEARFRVGDYRIIFEMEGENAIRVLRIRHRSSVYKD